MPTPHQRQKERRAGRTVLEPMANTMKSVREVTVMATPALRMVSATVEGMSEDNLEKIEMLGKFICSATSQLGLDCRSTA